MILENHQKIGTQCSKRARNFALGSESSSSQIEVDALHSLDFGCCRY